MTANNTIQNSELEIANAKIAELERLIANLAHSIKGLMGNSMSSLECFSEKFPKFNDNVHILQAFRKSDLVCRTVNAIFYSGRGGVDDFIYDATHIDSKSQSLHSIIYDSIFISLENVFDGWNFGKIQQRFIEDRETFTPMKIEFDKLEPNNFNQLLAFCEKYFFYCNFDIEALEKFTISNSRESATKLLILFQEIIFNRFLLTFSEAG